MWGSTFYSEAMISILKFSIFYLLLSFHAEGLYANYIKLLLVWQNATHHHFCKLFHLQFHMLSGKVSFPKSISFLWHFSVNIVPNIELEIRLEYLFNSISIIKLIVAI